MKQQNIQRNVLVVLIPLSFSFLISWVFYPGFMSYDSIHALTGARDGVTDSTWPPMVSYIWRVLDHISSNPSIMHFSQLFLLFLSLFVILFRLTKRLWLSTLFLFVYITIPVILGTAAVIWKDVLTAAFLLAGFATVLLVTTLRRKYSFLLLSALALLLLFVGTATRHNSITAAVPIIFYLAWVIAARFFKPLRTVVVGTLILGVALSGLVYGAKLQLDHYSLPTFASIAGTEDFMPAIEVLDISGASLCAGKNLFGDLAPGLTLDDIRHGYDPRHVNLSAEIREKIPRDARLQEQWLTVLKEEPICFMSNRLQLATFLSGANSGDQFLITDPGIAQNDYGYALMPSSLRDGAVSYIVTASGLFFFRPWFLYLLGAASVTYLLWPTSKVRRAAASAGPIAVLFVSGVFYFGGLVLLGNAADARLPFYTTTVFALLAFLGLSHVIGERIVKPLIAKFGRKTT
jgi:hypothetical protein